MGRGFDGIYLHWYLMKRPNERRVRGKGALISQVDFALKHGLLQALYPQQSFGSAVSTVLACELVMIAVSLAYLVHSAALGTCGLRSLSQFPRLVEPEHFFQKAFKRNEDKVF